ncbi:kinase-like domain-containing protein [Daedaleopsis nitida]|nr:kinase-like domain-containing protein [Daedaleopsis nitida]
MIMSDPFSDLSDDEIFGSLSLVEMFWRDRYELFQLHGYTFRPRYHPDWVPSWRQDPTLNLFHTEDHVPWHALRPHLMDGIRLSDEKVVLIKRISSDSQEITIATSLSSPELRDDPTNHCVPILDAIQDTQDPSISFLVMPYLRYINQPEFDTVGSILNCVEQLLEGLCFLHKHHVAHRDCAYKNVMMDATAIYPRGFHPVASLSLPDDIRSAAPILPRSTVDITYYFVDFGISTPFAAEDTNKLVTGTHGLDRDVPELSNDVPYDPFKVDIFVLGNLFRQHLLERYTNVNVLAPLIEEMVRTEPTQRPTAQQALRHFRDIRQEVWTVHSLWRPHRADESLAVQAVLDTLTLCSVAYRSMFRIEAS